MPFEAKSRRVGADYFRELARAADGTFKRNPPGIGIVASMDALRGPTFDPAAVDPLIREFYEHTSSFLLHIRPEWKRRAQPFFLAFKRGIASRIGQANLPFDTEETQAGVVSYIDTIDFTADGIVDLRGWVRAYEASGEAIYVGVYTTFPPRRRRLRERRLPAAARELHGHAAPVQPRRRRVPAALATTPATTTPGTT